MATTTLPGQEAPGLITDVRAQLECRLPRWIQPLLSRVTGRPRLGEQPAVVVPTFGLVLAEVAALITASAIIVLAFSGHPWMLALLPYATCVAVGRLRWFQTELTHFAIHGRVKAPRLCQVFGTVVPLAINEKTYFVDHMKHHDPDHFGRGDDPDAEFLGELGFDGTKSEAELMRLLWRTSFSPRFHWLFLKVRIKSNAVTPSWGRKALGIVWMGVIVSLLAVLPFSAWLVLVFGVGIVGYQLSSLLQFTSEHRWLAEAPEGVRRSAALSHGRFCGETPPTQGGVLPWTTWMVRMMVIHLPVRLAVLPGSLPAHDAHHVAPRHIDPNWRRANYVRSELISLGKDKGMATREVWGLGPAIRVVFADMASKA